jgi:hypothetical protein
MTRAALGALALVCLTLVGWTAGLSGLAYLPFWIAAAAPGLTLGLRVFGRHAAGWVSGAAAGYATTCLVTWAVIAAGIASPFAFAAAWLVECAVLHAASRAIRAPAVALRPWTTQDTVALSAVLLLVPALMSAPYRNLGAADADGRTYFRAYFTADFVWHMALTSELGRFDMPPRNPYMAHRGLNYYWTYFLVPAAVTADGPAAVQNVEAALKVNAECTALLLLSSIFLFAWTAGGGALATALGVILVVLASSAEGFAAAWDLWTRGRPLTALRDTNVDAITAWWYNGLRIDGIHRTMFYTPQHGLSCTLGLLGLLANASVGARAGRSAVAASGVLLGLAATLNPFLGAAFSCIYGIAVVADAAVTRASLRAIISHWPAAIPPALALAWGIANAMGEGAGQALTVGWAGFARNAPLATLVLGLGPVLLPALAGFLPSPPLPGQPARVALVGLASGLFLFYFVVLSDRSWVGFRAGQIMLTMLALPLARVFARLLASRVRVLVPALATAMLILGAPTTIVDTQNASDIGNRRMAPGFPWTLTVSPAQHEALRWIRTNTRPDAIVQAEPIVRGRADWSFIPTFAARRTSAGLPISLLPLPEYQERARQVQAIFTSLDMETAHAEARRLGIEYLWMDRHEQQAYPGVTERFDAAHQFFRPVFRNSEVVVYAVR